MTNGNARPAQDMRDFAPVTERDFAPWERGTGFARHLPRLQNGTLPRWLPSLVSLSEDASGQAPRPAGASQGGQGLPLRGMVGEWWVSDG